LDRTHGWDRTRVARILADGSHATGVRAATPRRRASSLSFHARAWCCLCMNALLRHPSSCGLCSADAAQGAKPTGLGAQITKQMGVSLDIITMDDLEIGKLLGAPRKPEGSAHPFCPSICLSVCLSASRPAGLLGAPRNPAWRGTCPVRSVHPSVCLSVCLHGAALAQHGSHVRQLAFDTSRLAACNANYMPGPIFASFVMGWCV
jgi:hypothetical protein